MLEVNRTAFALLAGLRAGSGTPYSSTPEHHHEPMQAAEIGPSSVAPDRGQQHTDQQLSERQNAKQSIM